MSGKPLVSVTTIFLNEKQFIQEAIDSVFAQSYDHWELLLVDDGSTDGSTEIARRYAAQYPHKVRYLEHPGHKNLGMSASRALGVRKSHGKYITYVDGDDVWLPHKLEEQVAILEAYPEADLVHGPLLIWYSWTGDPEDLGDDRLFGVGDDGIHPYANSLVEPPKLLTLFLKRETFIPGGFLARRTIMERPGLYEEKFRDAYSDVVALVKICLTSTVFVSSECCYKYRKHPAASTWISMREGKEEAERRYFLNWVAKYLSREGITNPEIWQVLRPLLFRFRHPRLHRLKNQARYHGNRLFPSIYAWLRTKWRNHRKPVALEGH